MLTDEAELKKRELSWRDGSTIQHIKEILKSNTYLKYKKKFKKKIWTKVFINLRLK